MAKVKIKCDDFVSSGLKATVAGNGVQLLERGELKVDFELIVGDEYLLGLKVQDLQKAIDQKVLGSFVKSGKKTIAALVQSVLDFWQLEADGNADASEKAAAEVKNANAELKDSVGSLRQSARKAAVDFLASKKVKISPKSISTNGSSYFKEFKLAKGGFQVAPENQQDDITPLLKKSNGTRWLYFGIAATGTAGRVIIDLKKPVKKNDLKELREMEDVPDNASFFEGVIRASKSQGDLHFVNKVLKEKDVKQCFQASAPKFGKFKISTKQINEYPKDLGKYEG